MIPGLPGGLVHLKVGREEEISFWLARVPCVSTASFPAHTPLPTDHGGSGGGSLDGPTRCSRLLWTIPTFGRVKIIEEGKGEPFARCWFGQCAKGACSIHASASTSDDLLTRSSEGW